MATTTYHEYTGNASTTEFVYSFEPIKIEDVKVALNGVTQTTGYTATLSPAKVTFTSAPSTGVLVRVYRDTDVDSAKGVYAAGSSIRAVDLNNNQDQVLYALQEEQNQKGIFEEIKLDDNVKIKLGNSDGTEIYWNINTLELDSDSKIRLTSTSDQYFAIGSDIRFQLNTQVNSVVVNWPLLPAVDDTYDLGSNSLQWKDIYVDGTGYIDTISADTATINGNLVVTGNISDSGGNLELADDVNITGHLRLPDDKKLYLGNGDDASIDWDTDGWFDRVNIRSDGEIWSYVPSGKNHAFLVNDVAILAVYDDYVQTKHIKPVTDNLFDLGASDKEWRDLYVDGTAYVDELRLDDNEKIKLGNSDDLTIWHGDASSVGGENSNYISSASGRNLVVQVNDDANGIYFHKRTGTGLFNFETLASFTAGGACALNHDNNQKFITTSSGVEITGQVDLDDITGDAVVTTGTSTSDTKVYSAKHSEAIFLRQDSTETLASGVTWSSNDTTVPTTGAIDARVRGLITDVGGFRPIASEAAFPTTNPDPDNNAGTIVSITAFSANRTASGTTLTAGCQTTGGTQVTITGCPNNQAFLAGYGLLVETTSTLNTYTFVRYVADTSSIASVAGKVTEIGRLGTADAVADMNTLGTTAIVSDLDTLANISSNITTVAGVSSNVTTVAGVSSNVTTVAGIQANVTTVAGISSDVTAVAGDAADIGTCSTNIGAIAAIGSDLANNFENITDHGAITAAVTSTSGTSDITTLASGSNLTNIATVAGISSNVTTVAGDTTAINNITTNLSAVQNAATNATNAASSATAAASSATSASTSATTATTQATTATTQATTATTQATTATTQATNASTSATSAASSATTATSQASTATTQASNASTSAANALAYKNLALTYRNDASGILTQTESIPYNLVDSASTHTAWGNITDTGVVVFANETSNTMLSMSEGSATYNYGSIT